MVEVVLAGILMDIVQFIMAGGAVWGALRFLDYSIGNSFTKAYDEIKNDSFSLAVYHGLRLMAAAILFGSIVG